MHAFIVIFSNRNLRLGSSNSGINSDFFFLLSFQQVFRPAFSKPMSSICFGLQFPEFSVRIDQEFWELGVISLAFSLFVALLLCLCWKNETYVSGKEK